MLPQFMFLGCDKATNPKFMVLAVLFILAQCQRDSGFAAAMALSSRVVMNKY